MKKVLDKELIVIGRRVEFFRKKKGYSQEMLAELIGVSGMTISRIETESTAMSIQIFIRLMAALDASANELLGDEAA